MTITDIIDGYRLRDRMCPCCAIYFVAAVCTERI